MKRKLSGLFSACIAVALLVSLFSWPTPTSAGIATWSAETIPTTTDNILGPAGIDIRDFALAGDGKTIYAVPGDSILENVVYKSINTGASWTAITVDIEADLVAVAPDDKDIVVIANSSTPVAYLSTDGGSHWYNIGTPQASGGNPAAAIYDIAVSEVRESIRYIAAAGEEAGDTANLWYFNSGASVPVWKETRNLTDFSAGNEVAAVAFSPSFLTDTTMLAVTEHDSGGVRLQILNLNAEKWNSSADHTAYPLDVVSNSGVTGLNSASISLSPSYLASDEATHRIFIGLTVNGNASAIATSGIYRFIETTRTNLSTDKKIHSVAFSGSYLVAGRYDASTVYYSTNPLATTPTISTGTTTKGPGGGSRVIVTWAGSNVLAGTSGNESAFAISADRGSTFNDISLIDTIMVHARDVAVSPDGSKVYLVTDDGTSVA